MSTTKKWLESVLISNGHEEFIDIMLIYNREKLPRSSRLIFCIFITLNNSRDHIIFVKSSKAHFASFEQTRNLVTYIALLTSKSEKK